MSEVAAIKRCCTCRAAKPLADFNRDRCQPDGLDRRCRGCKNANRNKEQETITNRLWNQRNREHKNMLVRRSYAKHRVARNAHAHEYRKTTDGWITCKLIDIRKRAAARGVPCDVDADLIRSLMVTHCPVFGVKLVYGGPRCPATASIDRIIPAIGYVAGNMAVMSDRANSIKNVASLEEIAQLHKWMQSVVTRDGKVRTV